MSADTESPPVVGIIMGSQSDEEIMTKAGDELAKCGIAFESKVMSAHHDPYIEFDHSNGLMRLHDAQQPIGGQVLAEKPLPSWASPQNLQHMTDTMRRVFQVLEAAWAEHDVTMVDIKIEFGLTADGRLVLADVVDNDSWRIWLGGTKKGMLDKQLFRDLDLEDEPEKVEAILQQIMASFERVADFTEKFHEFDMSA